MASIMELYVQVTSTIKKKGLGKNTASREAARVAIENDLSPEEAKQLFEALKEFRNMNTGLYYAVYRGEK